MFDSAGAPVVERTVIPGKVLSRAGVRKPLVEAVQVWGRSECDVCTPPDVKSQGEFWILFPML